MKAGEGATGDGSREAESSDGEVEALSSAVEVVVGEAAEAREEAIVVEAKRAVTLQVDDRWRRGELWVAMVERVRSGCERETRV